MGFPESTLDNTVLVGIEGRLGFGLRPGQGLLAGCVAGRQPRGEEFEDFGFVHDGVAHFFEDRR